ncbi:MAG: molybdenum-binding protein [Deltaproteobacteria bacterium]|nr:MAG: molybdenum-binding protein [Deltaproteobacteria bacterium]RPJ08494.1 MAG: molybdenum-binding protein [Deltaproteobacteria bacterium]
MKHGARNKIQAKVKSVKKGDIMSLVKFAVTQPHEMASVLTTESVKDLKLKAGDQVELIIYSQIVVFRTASDVSQKCRA